MRLAILAVLSAAALCGQSVFPPPSSGNGQTLGTAASQNANTFSLQGGYLSNTYTVGTGGVTAGHLVQFDSTSKAIGATAGYGGIAASTVSAAGTVEIQRLGIASCAFENAAVIGDIAIPGTDPTECRDSGLTSSTAVPDTTPVIGLIQSSAVAGSSANVRLHSVGVFGTQVPVSQVTGLATSATTDTTNASNISSGTLPTGRLPALTGDVTSSAGSNSVAVTKINGTALSGLSTGLVKNTTGTGIPSIASVTDLTGLFSGTCNSTTVLGGDGTCQSVSSAFSAITSGTNTIAAMLIGSGSTLNVTGSGTINATSLGGSAASLYAKLAAPAFTGAASADTNTWCVDSTNHRLGVGTCSPSQLLHVTSASSGGTFALFSNTNASGNRTMLISLSPDTGPSSLTFTLTGRLNLVSNQLLDVVAPNVYIGPTAVASSSGTLTIADATSTTGATRVNINLGAADAVSTVTVTNAGRTKSTGGEQVTAVTVSTLPTCGGSQEGTMLAVTDATAPTFLGTLTGGGTVHSPVYCNGTAWVAY